MTAMLHTTFLALCTTQIQMFMVTFLTFVFPLCFRLQLGTEQAVVRNNFTILFVMQGVWNELRLFLAQSQVFPIRAQVLC